MKLKEFKELMQEAAIGTQFEGKELRMGRFNDKRKHHRRIKFMTAGNIDYAELYLKVYAKLLESGYYVEYDDTIHNYWGDGSVVQICFYLPL